MKKILRQIISFTLVISMVLFLCLGTKAEDITTTTTENEKFYISVDEYQNGLLKVVDKELINDKYEFNKNEIANIEVLPNENYELEKIVFHGMVSGNELVPLINRNIFSIEMNEDVNITVFFKEAPVEEKETTDLNMNDVPSTNLPSSNTEEIVEGNKNVTADTTDITNKKDDIKNMKDEDSNNKEEIESDRLPELEDVNSTIGDILYSDNNIVKSVSRSSSLVYLGKVTYGDIKVGHFTINGNIAFCMEHRKTTPITSTGFESKVYDNANIKKVLYYGWKGPGQWSGFKSEAQGICYTSLACSYYYSGPSSMSGGAAKKIQPFLSYCAAQPDIQNTNISLSSTYEESYLTTDHKAQRTNSIKLNTDSRNSITIPLPNQVRLINETTGKTFSGKAIVYGGQTFHLEADLSVVGTWKTGTLKGSMKKFNAVIAITDSSSIQDVGQGVTAVDPNNNVSFSVKWVQMGDLKIIKFLGGEEEIKIPAQGVEFTLTHQVTGEVVKIVTDKDGVATTEDKKNYPIGRLIGGDWKVEETKSIEGYKPIDPFIVTVVGQGEVYSYIAEDKNIVGAIQVIKVDKETNKPVVVSNATFKVVNKKTGEDIKWTQYSPEIKTFTEFKTDENGQYTLPNQLPYGEYQLIEIKAPEGYLLTEKPIDFSIDKMHDLGDPLIVKAENDNAKGKLKILKTDKESSKPIKGAVFEIVAEEDIVTGDGTVRVKEGEVVDTITSDKDGIAESRELYLGKYIVTEIKPAPGYVINSEPKKFELKYENEKTPLVYFNMELTNQPSIVIIEKVAMGTENGIEGTKFQIWNKDIQNESIDPDMFIKETYTTDKNGNIKLKYLLQGTYCVQEVRSTPGYILNDEIKEVVVNEDGTIKIEGQEQNQVGATLRVENDFTKVQISKQDITTGKELPGASLEVVDVKTGNIYEKWISTNEVHIINAIPEGEYILREKMAPKGYLIASEIRFTVKNNAEITKVVMKDELSEGNIYTSIPENFRDGSGTLGNGARTGDNIPVFLLIIIAVLSGLSIGGVLIYKKRGTINEK